MKTKEYPLDPVELGEMLMSEMEAEWQEKLRTIKAEHQRRREEFKRWIDSMFPPTGTVAVAW